MISTKMNRLTAIKKSKVKDKVVDEQFYSIFNARRRRFELEDLGYKVVLLNTKGEEDVDISRPHDHKYY